MTKEQQRLTEDEYNAKGVSWVADDDYEYYESIDYLRERYYEYDREWPSEVHGTYVLMLGPGTLNADDILSSALEEFHEDAAEQLDTKSLQVLLDTWAKAQDLKSYMHDDKVVVVLDTPDVWRRKKLTHMSVNGIGHELVKGYEVAIEQKEGGPVMVVVEHTGPTNITLTKPLDATMVCAALGSTYLTPEGVDHVLEILKEICV